MAMQLNDNGYPILDQFSEEGFIDCVLRVCDLSETDRSYCFHLAAAHGDDDLGFDVEVVKNIQGGFDADVNLIQAHVYHKGVIFRRSGPESDSLIRTLASLYDITPQPTRMVDEESFTAICLQQGRLDMTTEGIKLKLFGKDTENFSEEEYYESFFNLDLAHDVVYWNEKDLEYRLPLIRGLSEQEA